MTQTVRSLQARQLVSRHPGAGAAASSQINGCAFCTDMHTKDSQHLGKTRLRLNLVAIWREATVFTDAERAALELTEQGTRIAMDPAAIAAVLASLSHPECI